MSDLIPVVYAIADASVNLHTGGQVPIHKGTHWPANDPVVAQYPQLFAADTRWGLNYTQIPDGYDAAPTGTVADAQVEQATAAPGEKRNARRG